MSANALPVSATAIVMTIHVEALFIAVLPLPDNLCHDGQVPDRGTA